MEIKFDQEKIKKMSNQNISISSKMEQVDDFTSAILLYEDFKKEFDNLLNKYIEKINIFNIYKELKVQCLWAEFNCNKILEKRFKETTHLE